MAEWRRSRALRAVALCLMMALLTIMPIAFAADVKRPVRLLLRNAPPSTPRSAKRICGGEGARRRRRHLDTRAREATSPHAGCRRHQDPAAHARRRSLPHRQHHQDLHRDAASDSRRREEARSRRSGEQVCGVGAQRRQHHPAHAREHDERTSQLHRGRCVGEDGVLRLPARVDAARARRRGHQASARLPAGQGLALQQHELRAARHDPRAGHRQEDPGAASPRRSSSRSGSRRRRGPPARPCPTPYAHGITVQTLDDKQADATNRNPSWAFTAGELISTMADLRTWVVSYTTGSLVSPAMQKQRLTWVTMPPMTPGACLRHRHRHRPRLARPHGRAAGVQLQRVLPADEEGGDRRDGELRHSGRQEQSGADDHEGAGGGGDAGECAGVTEVRIVIARVGPRR